MPEPVGAVTDMNLPEMRAPPLGDYNYHVVISHHDDDRELVEHIKTELAKNDFICRCKDDIIAYSKSGAMTALVDEFLPESRKIVFVISEAYMNTKEKWTELERMCIDYRNAEKNEKMTITILHKIDPRTVPAYVKEIDYLESDDPQFWSKFTKALISDRTPLSTTIEVNGIAEGLAWGYYYNYLALFTSGLKQRLDASDYSKKGIPVCPKFIVLMPESGDCSTLIEMSKNIEGVGKLKNELTVIAGSAPREYNNSVKLVTDPDNNQQQYYAVIEYATPLWCMYEMGMSYLARLGTDGKRREIAEFTRLLEEIVSTEDTVITLSYDDRCPEAQTPDFLSRKIIEKIRQFTV